VVLKTTTFREGDMRRVHAVMLLFAVSGCAGSLKTGLRPPEAGQPCGRFDGARVCSPIPRDDYLAGVLPGSVNPGDAPLRGGGEVGFWVNVDEHGVPQAVELAENSTPSAAAEAYVWGMRFHPALRDGRPVPGRTYVAVH
jgi:hypothetical protein